VKISVLADAGAGFGEPLHTMRTLREFINAGVAACWNSLSATPLS